MPTALIRAAGAAKPESVKEEGCRPAELRTLSRDHRSILGGSICGASFVGHPEMPEFRLTPAEIDYLLACDCAVRRMMILGPDQAFG
jgi:hypothetical protein